MGFGKFVLGIAGGAVAIVAAPVVLPVAAAAGATAVATAAGTAAAIGSAGMAAAGAAGAAAVGAATGTVAAVGSAGTAVAGTIASTAAAVGSAAAPLGAVAVKAAPVIAGGAIAYNVGKDDGHYEGKKEGYNDASREYKEKYDELVAKFHLEKEELLNSSQLSAVQKNEFIEKLLQKIKELEHDNQLLSEDRENLKCQLDRMIAEVKAA